MVNFFRAEYLKYRRTFNRRLALFGPLLFLLLIIPGRFLSMPGSMGSWDILLAQAFNFWPVLFVPLEVAFMCSLAQTQETKAGNYRALRLHNIDPGRLWLAKIDVAAFHLLLASLTFMLAITLRGWLSGAGVLPWQKIVLNSLVIWWTSLPLIPLQMAAARWKGLAAGMALGLVGSVGGVLVAPTAAWWLMPWSWSLRLMCPLVGVHPNGVPLAAGDALRNAGVIWPGIAIAFLAFVAFIALTARWFSAQEVR